MMLYIINNIFCTGVGLRHAVWSCTQPVAGLQPCCCCSPVPVSTRYHSPVYWVPGTIAYGPAGGAKAHRYHHHSQTYYGFMYQPTAIGQYLVGVSNHCIAQLWYYVYTNKKLHAVQMANGFSVFLLLGTGQKWNKLQSSSYFLWTCLIFFYLDKHQ